MSTLIPARRMSLGEEEAFPVTKTDIQAPAMPEKMQEALGESSSAPPKRKNLVAIAFVVVAAIGAFAAVRFFIAASHDTPAVQE